MRKLTRDRVISVVHGKDLVGVYWEDTDVGSPTTRRKKDTDGSEILFECSPKEADRVILILNEEIEMAMIDQHTKEYEIQTIIQVILACDHALDTDYDNHPDVGSPTTRIKLWKSLSKEEDVVIDLTNMATSMVGKRGEAHLSDLRKIVADYLQSKKGIQCVKRECPYCEREIESVLYTEWGQKVWNGKEWEDDKPYGSSEYRCPQCNGSLDYEVLVAMGVV